MLVLVAGAKIFEDELAALTMEQLENKIDAPMSIGKVSLNPLFSFPRLSAEINNLWIGEPKSQNNDTIFFIKSLKVGLNSWDLIKGIYTIDKVEISGLNFDYIIDKTAKSNIDFIINTFADTIPEVEENTEANSLDFSAEKFKLEDIRVNYYDSLSKIGSQIFIPEITLKAKSKNDVYTGQTEGSLIISQCTLPDTEIDQMESCTINFDMDYKDKKASINKFSIISEGINLDIEGTVNIDDALSINAKLEAKTLDLETLRKYVPQLVYKQYGDSKLPQMDPIIVNLNMGYKDNDIDINKLVIDSEMITIEAEGLIVMEDTLSLDVKIDNLAMDIDELKKYIPIKYINEYNILDVGGVINTSASIKGKYADSTLLPLLEADINLKNFNLQTSDYPSIDTVNLKAYITNGVKVDMSEAAINISKFDIFSQESELHIVGSFSDLINPKYIVSTKLNAKLHEFDSLIPDSLAKNLEGNITASIKTSGVLPNEINDGFIDDILNKSTLSLSVNEVSALLMDSINVKAFNTNIAYSPQDSASKKIQIDSLRLEYVDFNFILDNSSLVAILSGSISDPTKVKLVLESFDFQSGENKITGSGKVKNIEVPEYTINTNIKMNLEELIGFVPDSTINSMSGTLNANISSRGRINPDSLETQLLPILFESSSFDLSLNNISLSFPDSTMNADNVSANISLKNDLLNIDYFTATYNGLKFEIDSSLVQNMYKTVLLNQKEELYVKTHIKLGDIFFDDFKHLMVAETTVTDVYSNSTIEETNTDIQNWTFLIHGSASVNSLIIDSTALEDFDINRLHINDMSALFKLTDSTYIIDQFKLKVFEGEMNNSLHYKVRDDGTQSVSTHNVISNMNIRTMLMDMDNFGMDSVITHENISGLFSTDLNTFVPIDDSVLINKVLVSGEITIEKGGVYNFPPAQEISKFTSIKELDNIQFKTLRSNIFMFKNKLYVPRTNIVSNAIDIAAFGMQSMIDDSEYHMEVHLSNILFGKSKKRNKKQDESGEEIDQESLKKNSQKIKYASTAGKSKVGRDTKEARELMMNKIRVQNKMLDFIFFPKNIHYNTELD